MSARKKAPVRLPRKYELEAMADALIQARHALENVERHLPAILKSSNNPSARDLGELLLSSVELALVPFKEQPDHD